MTALQPDLLKSKRASLDEDSERLLTTYTQARLDEGAAASTVSSERSQLRSLLRDSIESGKARTLAELVMDPSSAASALTCPTGSPGRASMQTRLRAFQRLSGLGVSDAERRARLEVLDGSLPSRRSRGWHDAGIAVAGLRGTGRCRTSTIDPSALEAIVLGSGVRANDDSALLGALCFSGLRVAEVRMLRWGDLIWNGAAESWEASVQRTGRRGLRFLIVGPGAQTMTNWRLESRADDDQAVFGARDSGKPLSARGFRRRVDFALTQAGHPSTRHSQIQSAFAGWLSASGFTDHEIKVVMGRREVRSVDRLLFAHRALAAQRQLAEQMEGAPLGSGSIGSH